MKSQLYKNKASEIIKDSIKSAVFIDEKAVEFFTTKPDQKIPEELLSENLFKNFKDIGISLSINKFNKNIPRDGNYYDYLLKKKDLILLDWKLDGEEGIEYSLEILEEVIKTKHLHFCTIYTSETNHENIINNLRSYFSGFDKEYYRNIKEELEIYELDKVIEKVGYSVKDNGHLYSDLNSIDQNLPNKIKEIAKRHDLGEALIQVKLGFTNSFKSDEAIKVPFHIDTENEVINLNNTIITILNKGENSAEKIINRLTEQITSSSNCFMQVLGLDMQNKFYENSSFINTKILNISINTLLYHRQQLLESISEDEFKNFMLSILLEQSKMTLSNSDLDILETSFLDEQSREMEEVSNEEIFLLNTFYNGSILEKEKLNFGDIFIDENNIYYLCIAPLCDCLHPGNVKNNLFFVKGIRSTNIEKCIESGDSGFKSYINEQTCVYWTPKSSVQKKEDKQEEDDKLQEAGYIKPFQIHIPDLNFDNDELEGKLFKGGDVKNLKLHYVFTLKNSYAQRIANHAFNHPIRVGVDFVKRDIA